MIEVDNTSEVKAVLRDISDLMTKAADARQKVTEAIAGAADEHGIPKKMLRKLAVTYHKQNFAEVQGENEEFSELYESIAM